MAALPLDELDELTEDQLLDVAHECAETARRAEVDLLRVAYQWALLHSPDRLDPAESAKPGREKAKMLGGPAPRWSPSSPPPSSVPASAAPRTPQPA